MRQLTALILTFAILWLFFFSLLKLATSCARTYKRIHSLADLFSHTHKTNRVREREDERALKVLWRHDDDEGKDKSKYDYDEILFYATVTRICNISTRK